MIIGVTGPICAGIDNFMNFFVEKGFTHFSYSDILRGELRRRGEEITRKNLQDIGDELREKYGKGILSKRMIEKMEPGKNYVVGNIRNPGEVEEFRKLGDFILLLIDSPFDVRFKRAVKRNRENEPLDLEGFKKMEERDLGIKQEEYGQQHGAVFKMADKTIVNDGSLEELREKVEELLGELKASS